MKLKSLIVILGTVSFVLFTYRNVASASGYDYANTATHSVKTTKTVKVYRVTVGKDEADNQFHNAGKIKKGTHLSVSDWVMSTGGGYVVTGKHKWKATSKTFYFVLDEKQTKWFK